MRKPLFHRFKALLTAARLTLYTKRAKHAKTFISPAPLEPKAPEPDDTWMFESETALAEYTEGLGREMDDLADSLTGLRETLSLIHGETPFPVEATTLAPCSIQHADADLFDGEVLPAAAAQDTTVGGDASFLFEDEARTISVDTITHEDESTRQAA